MRVFIDLGEVEEHQVTIDDEEDAEFGIARSREESRRVTVIGNLALCLLLIAVSVYRPVTRWWNRPDGDVGMGACAVAHVGFVSHFDPRMSGQQYVRREADDPWREYR